MNGVGSTLRSNETTVRSLGGVAAMEEKERVLVETLISVPDRPSGADGNNRQF